MCAQVDAYTCGYMYMSVGKCFGKRKAEKVTWGMGKGLGAIFFGLCDMTCKVLVPGTCVACNESSINHWTAMEVPMLLS